MTGAIPVFLTPTRNHFGIIGPIPLKEFKWKSIAQKIARHPLLKDGKTENGKAKPRVLTLTQSTYDGIIYNVETINEQLDGKIDTLHFDEAWLPHAAFHAFYRDMHAIGGLEIERRRNRDSMVFSTQSTHKMLAGLSQASQILIRNSQNESLDRYMFNEAFLMHTSTSPQYAIIASCDVAAAMMEPPGGTALVEESISEALDFRRAMRKVDRRIRRFVVVQSVGAEEAARRRDRHARRLDPEVGRRLARFRRRRVGLQHARSDQGDGDYTGAESRRLVRRSRNSSGGGYAVPGRARNHRRENRPVFILHHVHDRHYQGPLEHDGHRTATVQGRLRQEPAAMARDARIPERIPAVRKNGPRQLCDSVHEIYRQSDIARLTTDMYLSEMEPVMKPTDAYAQMAHSAIDRVPIDDLEGRVTAVLLTPYPPGIPLLIPGERINATIVRYLQFARDLNARYPGFGTDIHGLAKNEAGAYFLDCVSHNVHATS